MQWSTLGGCLTVCIPATYVLSHEQGVEGMRASEGSDEPVSENMPRRYLLLRCRGTFRMDCAWCSSRARHPKYWTAHPIDCTCDTQLLTDACAHRVACKAFMREVLALRSMEAVAIYAECTLSAAHSNGFDCSEALVVPELGRKDFITECLRHGCALVLGAMLDREGESIHVADITRWVEELELPISRSVGTISLANNLALERMLALTTRFIHRAKNVAECSHKSNLFRQIANKLEIWCSGNAHTSVRSAVNPVEGVVAAVRMVSEAVMPQSEVHPDLPCQRRGSTMACWLHYLQQEQQQTATMATTTASMRWKPFERDTRPILAGGNE